MSVAFHIAVHLVTLGHKDLDVAHPHHLPILPHAHLRVLRIIELYIRNARAPASSSYQMNPAIDRAELLSYPNSWLAMLL